MRLKHIIILVIILNLMLISSCVKDDIKNDDVDENLKPVIYLYPEQECKVEVALDYDGELTCTYPESDGAWEVLARPDGTLINLEDNKEYSYLFWEGIIDTQYDFSEGFVIKGEDTKDFLQEKLSYIGLTPMEYNEFIVFWLPKMKDNKYNIISFQDDIYTNSAKLTITPEPDSLLRVFMAYKPLDNPIQVKEQKLEPFNRNGFTVIEWGGSEIKHK